MGLLDVLNGMMQGPRGPSTPSAQSRGGMSPLTMAILSLLAWKAVRHLGGSQSAPAGAPPPSSTPHAMGGGLGDVLQSGLGGLLGGGAAGSVLSGGLGDLLRQLQDGAQPSCGLLQAQGWQLQRAQLQAAVLVASFFVMMTSLVLVADARRSKVRTIVRSQACPA